MNPMKFFWGLVFAGVGFLLLGVNLGWWSTNVGEVLWYLWPVIIIVLGIRFIVSSDRLFVILAVLTLLLSGFLIVKEPTGTLKKLGANLKETTENFSESYTLGEVEDLELRFNLGASQVDFFELNDEESRDSLYQLEAKNYGILTPKKKVEGKKTTIEFNEEMGDGRIIRRLNKRELKAAISKVPNIFLDINSGASQFDGNFSNLKLEKLDFRTGASEIDVKLGNLVNLLEANFEVGASSIEINVPKGVGLKVDFESESGLNNFRYSDEIKLSKNNHTYTSEGYDNAEKKINLRLSAGVSEIKINQY